MYTLRDVWRWWIKLKRLKLYDEDECKELIPPPAWPLRDLLGDYGRFLKGQMLTAASLADLDALNERLRRLGSLDCTSIAGAEVYFLLAQAYDMLGRNDRAVQVLRRAADRSQNEPGLQAVVRLGLALMLYKCRDFEWAERVFVNGIETIKRLADDRVHYNGARPYQELLPMIPQLFANAAPVPVAGAIAAAPPSPPPSPPGGGAPPPGPPGSSSTLPDRPAPTPSHLRPLPVIVSPIRYPSLSGPASLFIRIEDQVQAGEGMSSDATLQMFPVDEAEIQVLYINNRPYQVRGMNSRRRITLSNFTSLALVLVKGDSMNLRFNDGDYVLMRRQKDASTGEIVVADIIGDDGDHASTIKELKKQNREIILIPNSSNPEHKERSFESNKKQVDIQGVVVAALKLISPEQSA